MLGYSDQAHWRSSMSKFVRCLLTVLAFWFSSIQIAHASCSNPDFAADSLIAKWNERASTNKLGPSWQLEKYKGLGFIRQNLDGPSLLLTAQVDKSGCVTKLEIKSRRADTDGFAALVAWTSVINVTNPTLSKDQRKEVITALNLDKPEAGGSFTSKRVTYKYSETEETNDFSATSQ